MRNFKSAAVLLIAPPHNFDANSNVFDDDTDVLRSTRVPHTLHSNQISTANYQRHSMTPTY